KTDDSNKESSRDGGESDFKGDLDGVQSPTFCDACETTFQDWTKGAVYLCYYCTEMDLCQSCYQKRLDSEDGKAEDQWRVICPKDHKHIKGPVDGWKGLKDGVLHFEDKEIPFQHWLTEVKEKAWPEAW